MMSFLRICFFALPILGLARLLPLRFLENDDTIMMMLASGLYSGTPSAFLVYINHYLGSLLAALYTWFPQVHWYAYTQLGGLSLAMGLLCATAFERWRRGAVIGLPAFVAVFMLGLPFIVHISFTTTAAYVTGVGVWAIALQRGAGYGVIGAALIVLGGLLRFEAAALAFLASGPFLLLLMHQKLLSKARAGCLVLMAVAILAFDMAGARAYATAAPDYVAFDAARGKINDNPDAQGVADRLPDAISETDFALIMAFLADGEQITTEDITRLHEAIAQTQRRSDPAHWMAQFIKVVTAPPVALMLLALIGLAATCRNRQVLVYTLLAIAVYLGVQTYISVTATLKMRIILSIIAALLSALFFLPVARGRNWPIRIGVGLPALIMALAFAESTYGRLTKTQAGVAKFEAQRALVAGWGGPVHVYERHIVLGNRLFTSDLDPLAGQLRVAGWMVKHPQNAGWASHAALLEENAAMLVPADESAGQILAHLKDGLLTHYGVSARPVEVDRNAHGALIVFRAE